MPLSKLPPISKVYEALSAVADGRVSLEETEAYVTSSDYSKIYQMCRKTPCFRYGDIRHFRRIYVSNGRWNGMCLY